MVVPASAKVSAAVMLTFAPLMSVRASRVSSMRVEVCSRALMPSAASSSTAAWRKSYHGLLLRVAPVTDWLLVAAWMTTLPPLMETSLPASTCTPCRKTLLPPCRRMPPLLVAMVLGDAMSDWISIPVPLLLPSPKRTGRPVVSMPPRAAPALMPFLVLSTSMRMPPVLRPSTMARSLAASTSTPCVPRMREPSMAMLLPAVIASRPPEKLLPTLVLDS